MNIFFNIFSWCYVAFCICMIIYFLFVLKRNKKREKELDKMNEEVKEKYLELMENFCHKLKARLYFDVGDEVYIKPSDSIEKIKEIHIFENGDVQYRCEQECFYNQDIGKTVFSSKEYSGK